MLHPEITAVERLSPHRAPADWFWPVGWKKKPPRTNWIRVRSLKNRSSVKFGLRMESTLNFAWALLAAGMLILWLRHARSNCARWGTQVAALAMLLLILFPVISVTDDLQVAQNPAEAESYLRRDHASVLPHSIFPAAALLPLSVFSGICIRFLGFVAPSLQPAPLVDNPALAAIQNRPPPAA